MPQGVSLLDELRTQYEEARESTHEHADVEGFQELDARLRKAFRWLEKAVTYLDGLKPAIEHRFDLGHGLVFESPRFGRGSVGSILGASWVFRCSTKSTFITKSWRPRR